MEENNIQNLMKPNEIFLNGLYTIKRILREGNSNKLSILIQLNPSHEIFKGHFPGNPILRRPFGREYSIPGHGRLIIVPFRAKRRQLCGQQGQAAAAGDDRLGNWSAHQLNRHGFCLVGCFCPGGNFTRPGFPG